MEGVACISIIGEDEHKGAYDICTDFGSILRRDGEREAKGRMGGAGGRGFMQMRTCGHGVAR